jgi:adenylate cyclase
VRDYLLAEHGGLGGQLRTVTLLFSDIRGFTSASETMHPARVVDWLNQYFGEMAACIEAEGGMVNRYIGDAILAVFGAPNDHPRHAAAAIRAARRMREARDSLNRRLEADGFPAISAGIAVHTGAVLAGTIGSSQRMEYTVIGDPVNLTARFEKLTKTAACNILVSEDCRAAAGDDAGLRPMGRVKVRGSSRAIRLWGC